ncbi:hypothetical protein, variant [Fonticula alba]|uniref:Post-GPI attachment to proteins factor 3 n=1 Tax=Fonticula alba TaxID=691883 RepID=A0A058ZBM6_FONAL|nr:hypothetical protein, variant [Fonticula alba]KCV71323.1 hypothetical protein, variant [Fonticula alba]|eukprot:XP_009494445.1 hypothetical protein, variant [Fonticula alba]
MPSPSFASSHHLPLVDACRCCPSHSLALAASAHRTARPYRLLLWDRDALCRYDCMSAIVERDQLDYQAAMALWKRGDPSNPSGRPPHPPRVHQYHGKWPLRRLLLMQEPASVLFSVANFLTILLGAPVPLLGWCRRWWAWGWARRRRHRQRSSAGGGIPAKRLGELRPAEEPLWPPGVACQRPGVDRVCLAGGKAGAPPPLGVLQRPAPYTTYLPPVSPGDGPMAGGGDAPACGLGHLRLSTSNPLWRAQALYTLVGLNTWLWSAVFHTRDLWWTEYLDYFSATAWSLCSVYHASMRALPVVRTGRPHLLFSAFLLCLFLGHIGYLGLVSFDYGYNMLANVVVVSVSGVLWISWGASQLLRHRRAARHVWLCIGCLVLLSVGMTLELLDFPPIFFRTLDAHSLWHAWTAPISLLFYEFIRRDVLFIRQFDRDLYNLGRVSKRD